VGEATALPSGLAMAATWNPQLAYTAGAMIGEEARRKGLNLLLAGGANLARDPSATLCLFTERWPGPWMHVEGEAEIARLRTVRHRWNVLHA
jgi:hypothetical protein